MNKERSPASVTAAPAAKC